ncbi:glycosyltransferase [Chryseobacterium tongliaoense]|uniref:glycosyltransferase n=1 Tax=Chryseobacterium tongliaoense TaxID=3240933 RepID=UPI0035111F3B
MMKKISVIIVTYNSLKDIFDCIKSIYNYNDISKEQLEIIIVDNSKANVFEEMKMLVSEKYSDIKFIHNEKNGGYGQGNNIGIKASQSETVCVINPDVVLKTAMFSSVLNMFQNDLNLAVIGGKQKGGINLSFWIRPEYEFFLFTSPVMMLLNKMNIYIERFCFLSGALLFIDKKKFEKIGFFDENIFLYREESDIQKRFLAEKYRSRFEKKFNYLHLIDDRNGTSDFSFIEEMKSTKYYMKKYSYDFSKFLAQRSFYTTVMIGIYSIIGNNKKIRSLKETQKKLKNLRIELL